MHYRFHYLGEPGSSIRWQHHCVNQDFKIHRDVPASIFSNIWIEAKPWRLWLGASVNPVEWGPGQGHAHLSFTTVFHPFMKEWCTAEPAHFRLTVVHIFDFPECGRQFAKELIDSRKSLKVVRTAIPSAPEYDSHMRLDS